jgi:hypothetical protein
MLKTQREKAILKQGLIILGIMVGLYFFVLSPFLKEGSSILDEELERKTEEIKKYIARTGSLPSKEGFDKMEKQKSILEEKLQELVNFVDPEKARMSESNTEAGLYFIERLHSSIKEFSEEAGSNDIKLPENLGFGDGLPKERMVDTLLRQLESVEFVVGTLLKSKHIEFTAIKPLKSIDYIEPLSKEIFYTELPVQISIKTDTKTLIELLLQLKNQSPLVSLKELHIKSSDLASGDIEASLVLSSFKVAKGDVVKGAE